MPDRNVVIETDEFRRVTSLPRDDYEAIGVAWADKFQEALKTPGGTFTLRPWQAAALYYAVACGGLYAAAGVGAGKTIVSLLIPVIVQARRPVLMLPAAAKEKTEVEILDYRKHFQLHPFLHIMSYEALSRISGVDMLRRLRPDVIIADEAHKLKDVTTARGRRWMRYFSEYPTTQLYAMSGTPTTTSVHDYAHHLVQALGDGAPLPRKYQELEMWAGALDQKPRKYSLPGAMRQWCEPGENVRQAYRRRLGDTPGVILTTQASSDAKLTMDFADVEVPTKVQDALKKLYDEWVTPGGEECQYAMELWRHGRELSCGFYYRWIWPTDHQGRPRINWRWLEARAEWHRFVRDVIQSHRGLDSPLAVRQAVENSRVQDDGLLDGWLKVKLEYDPVVEPVWLDDFFVKTIVDAARNRNALVWVEHQAFGEKLRKAGLSYLGPEATQMDINSAHGSVAVSLKAHSEAKNLQLRSDNIVVSPPTSGATWEQLIGRTHRQGQMAPEVRVTTYRHTEPFRDSFAAALQAAAYMQDTMGQKQRLLMAEKT